MENTFVLYFTLNNSNLKNTYYIKMDFKNGSELKAKNLIAKKAFTDLIVSMGIKDKKMIDTNKKSMIKSIKKNIYDSTLESLQNDIRFNLIEVTGNIEKTVIKTEAVQRRVNRHGIVTIVNSQGIKYNSQLCPNLDLYIVKNEETKHMYYLIEKSTGYSLLVSKSKSKTAIENKLKSFNVTEAQLIKEIDKIRVEQQDAENKDVKSTIDINTINTTNTVPTITSDTNTSYIVANRCFGTIELAQQYCNSSDFDYSMIIIRNMEVDEHKQIKPKNNNTKIDSNNFKQVTELKKSCTNKVENKSLYKDYINSIKVIDEQLDILDNKYTAIQSNRKSKGLSLAIYKCTDNEALQLIKIDEQMKVLERKQDKLKAEYNKNYSIEYKKQVDALVKSYDNYKYKVVINHNKDTAQFTNNFHDVIKNYTDNDTIQVLKLLYLHQDNKLPQEIEVYNHSINQWNLLEENRYYYTDNDYLLEKQLYYNHKLINKFIYRGDMDITAYCHNNITFVSINNIEGNYGIEITKENNNISYRTIYNIGMQRWEKGINTKGQELITKIKNRYKNDKYININELIPA